MSIRIKVSYSDQEELYEVIRRLLPIYDIKVQPQKGKFKRAYIDIKGAELDILMAKKILRESAENIEK